MRPTDARRSSVWLAAVIAAATTTVSVIACAPAIVPLGTVSTPVTTADGDTLSETTPDAAAAEAPVTPVVTTSMFRDTINALFAEPAFRTASWSALVLNERGDTVYAYRPAQLLVPASNMKIVTAAVALAQLGPDYRFADSALALAWADTLPSDFGPMYDTLYVRDHSLRDVLAKTLKPSQNRLAEELARTVALERTGSSRRDSAAAVVSRQLAAWGVPADGYIVYDGSGYDRANYLSAETITHVLWQLRSDTAFTAFYDALPIAGVDGTLVRRMRATAAERNAHAKTGSLRAIRSLSGYVTTAGGEQLTFSFLCNAYTTNPDRVMGIMDRAVALLAQLAPLEERPDHAP